jgi:hypothetical protein
MSQPTDKERMVRAMMEARDTSPSRALQHYRKREPWITRFRWFITGIYMFLRSKFNG